MDHSYTILIVDDEATGRELLEAHLQPQGYNLAFAGNGPAAIEKAADLAPDVILLDVMMPGMTGFEVCQRLKADEHHQHIPIILVTALNSTEDLVRGFDSGADDFLHKPVNRIELRARVRSMLRIKAQHDELQARNKKLEAALQLREDMAHMLVHDMKVPLTSILGFSELMLVRGDLTLKYLNKVEVIHKEAQRLHSFVNDMLTIAKMEDGRFLLNCSAVDINQLVQTVEKNHSVLAQSRQIKLVVEMPEGSRQVSLDTTLFQRVVDNLLSNALKFSPPESLVRMRVEYPHSEIDGSKSLGPQVRLQIIDEGPGIAEEHRDHIFEKFETVALKRSDVSQVGLGLAFCKMVVEAHAGRIWVAANEPTGSVFTLEI